ncbi:MAG: hypothetical protein IJK35_07510 [Oscillospiraceae bacterium]|nr:hypothetical protein [Oscillospiraceae bacterium]
MIEADTVRLLRECDAGVRMGVASIDQVLDDVQSAALKQKLFHSREAHETLGRELQGRLARFGDEGRQPNPIARGMSWLKTETRLGLKRDDRTIADLMTDGCGMGVKSLSRYLNQYKAADEPSKDMARRLISLEDSLGRDLRDYL